MWEVTVAGRGCIFRAKEAQIHHRIIYCSFEIYASRWMMEFHDVLSFMCLNDPMIGSCETRLNLLLRERQRPLSIIGAVDISKETNASLAKLDYAGVGSRQSYA